MEERVTNEQERRGETGRSRRMHGVKRCVDEQGNPEPREGKSKCKRDRKKLKGRGEKDVKKMQIQLSQFTTSESHIMLCTPTLCHGRTLSQCSPALLQQPELGLELVYTSHCRRKGGSE